jgi:hypothetical protein
MESEEGLARNQRRAPLMPSPLEDLEAVAAGVGRQLRGDAEALVATQGMATHNHAPCPTPGVPLRV